MSSRSKSMLEKRQIKAIRIGKVAAARTSERGLRCEYCHSRIAPGEATADHIKPISGGGLTLAENIALCCALCNRAKGSMSRARFVAAIKGPAPRGRDSMLAAWARRKIALAADRACRRLAAAAGLAVGAAP